MAEKRKKVTLKIKDKKSKEGQQFNLNEFSLDPMFGDSNVTGGVAGGVEKSAVVNVMDWGMPF